MLRITQVMLAQPWYPAALHHLHVLGTGTKLLACFGNQSGCAWARGHRDKQKLWQQLL